MRQDLLCGDEEGELSITPEHEPAAEEENTEYDLDAKQPSIKKVRGYTMRRCASRFCPI